LETGKRGACSLVLCEDFGTLGARPRYKISHAARQWKADPFDGDDWHACVGIEIRSVDSEKFLNPSCPSIPKPEVFVYAGDGTGLKEAASLAYEALLRNCADKGDQIQTEVHNALIREEIQSWLGEYSFAASEEPSASPRDEAGKAESEKSL
jgi:hypothetical protein